MPVYFFCITSFPKGARAREANLKCCLAKGIPIIVINNKMPSKKCDRQIHKPPSNIHKMFMSKDSKPGILLLVRIFLPKGHKAMVVSFNVCNPKGMPIMVGGF